MTDERIETGALQIDDDWTGLFIRGDDAFYLRPILRKAFGDGKSREAGFIYKLIRIIDIDVDHTHVNDAQRIKTR